MTHPPQWTQYIHHDSSEMYLSDILPRIGDDIQVRIRVPPAADLKFLYLRSRPDGEWKRIPMAKAAADSLYDWWTAEMPIIMHHNNYCFHFLTESGSFYYHQHGISPIDSPDWFHFTVPGDYEAPAWVREQVFYQIFPERFANGDPSRDRQAGEPTPMGKPVQTREWGDIPKSFQETACVEFFGGDLPGITQHLDYLQALGVTAIYLNPIFDAETNHFYDIRDFNRVAEGLGSDEALEELRQAMTARDMRLILDITPNHIGFHHPWFAQAQENPESATAAWFYRHPDSGEFEHWLGVPALVKLNYRSQALRDAIYRQPDSPIRKWLRPPYSIDGWRLDVANMTGNYWQRQESSEVWREMRQAIKGENPQAYMMGEYFQDGSPFLQGDGLDAIMNYQGFNTPVRRWMGEGDLGVEENKNYGDPSPLPTESMALQWQQYLTAIPYAIALQQFNQISSHDISRPMRITKGDCAMIKAGTALLMGFPGTPCVYYGDEIGLDGGHDPDNRRCMPWDESLWNRDLRDFHQKVIRIRKNSPALQRGGFQILYAGGDLIAFQRQSLDEQMIVAVYRGADGMAAVGLDMVKANLADGSRLTDLLTGRDFVVGKGRLRLEGLAHGQALFLRVSRHADGETPDDVW